MILVDSNILIYSADEKYKYLRDLFKQEDVFLSIITRLEVLGYHAITPKQIIYFDAIFKVSEILVVIDQAISYREKKLMSVADSIIAATAKIYEKINLLPGDKNAGSTSGNCVHKKHSCYV